MNIYIKGLNTCTLRRQKLKQYRDYFIANGHNIVNDPKISDINLIWTCAFRSDVKNNSISEIVRYQKDYNGEVIVAGCLPDIDRNSLKEIFHGKIVNWKDDKNKMEEFFGYKDNNNVCNNFDDISTTFCEKNFCEDATVFKNEHSDKDMSFQDQFIKLVISEGCNNKCAYCSERLAFPHYHSFSENSLVNACKNKIDETGKLDIVLLADSLEEYGSDIGSSLPNLINRLKTINPNIKIALNNFNPSGFIKYFDDMNKFLKNGYIRHLNIPIQSASSKILKSMNRPYTREDIDRVFGLLNDIKFTEFDTHVIVGFPGETEKDFDETIKFILKYRPKHVQASSYMELPEMSSSKIGNKIDKSTIKDRTIRFTLEMKNAKIICNSDVSDVMKDKLRRVNL